MAAQDTPATPKPLSVLAAIVPATWAPWKLEGWGPTPSPTSVGSLSMPSPSPATSMSEIMSIPGAFVRSVAATVPVSRTATRTALLPVVIPQARGSPICS